MIARYSSLAVLLLLVTIASVIGSGFEAGEWYYITMKQPSVTPPAWLFILVSALVYVSMALAAWNVWLTGHYSRKGALAWWFLLLVLNIAWSGLFFGLHRTGLALPVLALAVGVAILCIRAFSLLSRQSAYLMTPYLFWTAFILLFNFAVWTKNGGFLAHLMS